MGFQTPSCAAGTSTTVWFDDHVPDVTTVPRAARHEPTITHDASADAGRHDHADHVGATLRRSTPHFA
jgi:hypothetical protein